MRRAWLAYLAGGGLLAAGYFLLPALTPLPADTAKVVFYSLVGLSAVAAILVGVRRHRPSNPLVWYLLAAGRLCYLVADVLFFTLQHVLHVDHVPTVADAFYLGSYPFLVAGLLLVVRLRSPGGDRAGLIDALIVAVGAALVSWAFLIAPFVGNPDLTVAGQVTSAAYPVAGLTVAAVAARPATGSGGRAPAFRLVVAALLVTLASNSIYVALQLRGAYHAGGPLDGGWLLVHLLWGAAALHPSMRRLTEPAAGRPAPRPGRLALLSCAALTPPAVLAVQSASGRPPNVPLIVVGWVALLVLVVARLGGLFRLQEQAVRRERALREASADLAAAASLADSAAAADERQRLGPPAAGAGGGRRHPAAGRRLRPGPAAAGAGGHRERPGPGRGGDGRQAAGPHRPRHPGGGGRLRHRLLLAQLPPPLPGAPAEDRQVLRQAAGRRPRGLGAGPGGRAAGPDAALETVAEGIETAAQADALRDLGCTFGQGYHVAKPPEAGEVEELLEAGGVVSEPARGGGARSPR
jgi:hypothetical protein